MHSDHIHIGCDFAKNSKYYHPTNGVKVLGEENVSILVFPKR